MRVSKLIIMLLGLVLLTACGDDPSKPYLKIVGGGFTNDVVSNVVTYNVAVKRLKTLPSGSVIEATFDLPNTDRKYVTVEPTDAYKDKYLLQSEALQGLKKNVPLTVKLRLLDSVGGKELAEVEKSFQSDVDQE
jgi:hypothetical protein